MFEYTLGAIFRSMFPRKVVYKNNFSSLSDIDKVKLLERRRQLKGYKKGWLYHQCKDEGLLVSYEELFGEYVYVDTDATKFRFGKYKGKYVEDIWESDRGYIDWLAQQDWLKEYSEENEMISDLYHLEEENAV